MTFGTAEMIGKGQVTIPKALRDENGHKEGTRFEVISLGGRYLLEPIDRAADAEAIEKGFLEISKSLADDGVSLDDMLRELRRIRESQ